MRLKRLVYHPMTPRCAIDDLQVLRGHDQGVLSLSWCPQDNDLMLSCGKDNRTICWNPNTNQPYGEFPVVTNWTFQTRWNPHNPNLFATASFDGKIAVQTIQSIKLDKSQETADPAQALDGEDFFSKAQTQPQADTFSLPKPPKWMEPPVAVSFGFGGKVVSIMPGEGPRSSKIRISTFEVDAKVGTATEGFEEELKAGNLRNICESRVASATTDEERADWRVIETLISDNPRQSLVGYLGFSDEADEAADGLAKLGLSEEKADTLAAPQVNGSSAKTHNRLSSFFDNADGDSFLSDLAASKGAKTNNPFQIYTGSESESDRRITRSLILGQFEKALDICLEEDRMSDAFMVAVCGGERCIEKAQAAYFAKQSGGPNYLRLLASVVGKNLWDVVYNADLANWKEVMATLCTFADPKDYPDLCEALGDRLEDQMKEAGDRDSIRKDASFCFLAGSKLEKVVAIWIDELHGKEAAGQANRSGDSSFSIHTQALQNLIEKVTIFREVTRFQDSETRKTSDWKLAALYEKYIEYAEVVAAHGQIKVAEKYLDLLPTEYPLATMARHRVKQATRKDAPAVAARPPAGQATSTARTSSKPLPPIGAFQAQQSPARSQPALPYAPPAATQPQPANPYAPNANQYSNMGYQPPQQMRPPAVVPPPPQQFGASQYNQPTAPPPRAYSQSPSIPPPSQAKDMSNWNDIPDGFAKPTSRRGTPGIGQQQQPLSSPFPNQPAPFQAQQGLPPPAGPPRGGARQTPPVAPPPKGPPPPQRMSSPLTGGPPMERPSSSTAHMYAPSQTMSPPVQNIPPPVAPPIARGPSPYNAPPSGPPPPNRYAPTPAAQQQGGPPQPPTSIPPPPSAASFQSAPAPINPYAPQARQGSMPASPYTPSSPPSQPMHQPPHQAVPQQPPQAPPQGPPSQGSRPGTATSQRRAPPSAPKYRKCSTISPNFSADSI
jgi:protein transport protein SEC31